MKRKSFFGATLLLLIALGFCAPVSAGADDTKKSPTLDLLYYHADWCLNCQKMGPIFDRLKSEYQNRGVDFIKLDITSGAPYEKALGRGRKAGIDNVMKYNSYTGVFVLVDAKSGEKLETLHVGYFEQDMKKIIEKHLH